MGVNGPIENLVPLRLLIHTLYLFAYNHRSLKGFGFVYEMSVGDKFNFRFQ